MKNPKLKTLDLAKFQISMRTSQLIRFPEIVFKKKMSRTIAMMMATRRF